MTETKEIKLEPIGYVKRKTKDENVRNRSLTVQVVINPRYIAALDGVEDYSHLFIIFYMHKIPKKQEPILKVHPRGRVDIPLQGIFATRTPQRPNPVGVTIVQLIERKENILVVKGLDAYDNTPILDIKPYNHWDSVAGIRVPGWLTKLEETGS